jgi:hypothetical protein
MDEQQQAVEAAGFITRNWQWLTSTVALPVGYVLFKNRERIAVLEERVCDSEEARTIINEENKPIQDSISQLIQRMGEHNDNVNRRMDKLSDTMTGIALHIGPHAPLDRREGDR